MTLNFGLHYSCQSPAGDWPSLYADVLDQARLAERLGYHSLEVAEHHFLPDGWIPSPTVLLGGLAAVTTDVRLQTGIMILPLHHPIEVAEQIAVLDNLSNGRMRVGVAIGWRDEEFDAFGIDKRERVPRTEEGIRILRRLLSEDAVSHAGQFYEFEDVTVTPRPVQDRIPLWYGGMSPGAIERAATMADAWFMSPIETVDELAELRATYDEALAASGGDPTTVPRPLRREAYVAETDERAWAEVWESLLYEYREVYGDYTDAGHTFDPADEDQAAVIEELKAHAEDRFLVGSPETVVGELETALAVTDADEVVLRMHFPGLDAAKVERSMRLVAEEVMPHFE